MTTRYVVLNRDMGYNDEYYQIGSGYDLDPRVLRDSFATREEAEAAARAETVARLVSMGSGSYGISVVEMCGEGGRYSDYYPGRLLVELYPDFDDESDYRNAPKYADAQAKCIEVYGHGIDEAFPNEVPDLHTVHEIEV